jgi:hypothetical protein
MLVEDQRALDGLLFGRRMAEILLREEMSCATLSPSFANLELTRLLQPAAASMNAVSREGSPSESVWPFTADELDRLTAL